MQHGFPRSLRGQLDRTSNMYNPTEVLELACADPQWYLSRLLRIDNLLVDCILESLSILITANNVCWLGALVSSSVWRCRSVSSMLPQAPVVDAEMAEAAEEAVLWTMTTGPAAATAAAPASSARLLRCFDGVVPT